MYNLHNYLNTQRKDTIVSGQTQSFPVGQRVKLVEIENPKGDRHMREIFEAAELKNGDSGKVITVYIDGWYAVEFQSRINSSGVITLDIPPKYLVAA